MTGECGWSCPLHGRSRRARAYRRRVADIAAAVHVNWAAGLVKR